MANQPGGWFSAGVEGDIDEAALVKVAATHEVDIVHVFGRTGKHFLHQRLEAYNLAARFSPWIVLLDLDHDAECAPALRARLLPKPSRLMSLRIAVRAIESWLLADRREFASFLGVGHREIPDNPDDLDDPKGFVIDLARGSRRRLLRTELVPRLGSQKRIGPAYTSRMLEFTLYSWDPIRAEKVSPSLMSCRAAIRLLKDKSTVSPHKRV